MRPREFHVSGSTTFSPPVGVMIHVFTDKAKDLATKLKRYLKKIKPAGLIWVSWPKKASKRPTDITEDVIRELA